MKKKNIIEIVGLPGSGKSYLLEKFNSDEYIEKLDENSFYQKCKEINLAKKIKYYLFLMPKILKIKKYLLKFEKEQGIINEAKEENKKFIKYYILQRIIIDDIKKKYVVLDQWNVQFIVSVVLSSDEPIIDSDNLKKLLNILVEGYNYKMLFYNVDAAVAAEKAMMRDKKFRMDDMEMEELKHYYSIHSGDYIKVGEKYFSNEYSVFTNLREFNKLVNEICLEKN